MRLADRAIGLVSIAILARLLLPDDFGLVGYAMAFFAILEIFFQFSFETVLIRDQDAGREAYDTAWTLDLIKGAVLGLLMVVGAAPIAEFFNEPEVETVLQWLAILPAVRGLENIGTVDFHKDMTFNKEFYFNFAVRFISSIATIGLAIALRSHWALVIGMLARAGLRIILSYIMSPYRPRLSLARFSRVFGFSKWLLFDNILCGLNERLPVVVIGRFFPAQAVAYFNVGIELSDIASEELAAPIRRALFPGVAKIAHDSVRMVQTLSSSLSVIVLLGLPVTIGMAVVAPLIVPVLLGENWLGVVPVIQVLAANSTTYILYSNSHIAFLVLNRPEITTYLSTVRTVMLVPALFVLVPGYGAEGAAWAMAGANAVTIAIDYGVVLRMVDWKLRQIVAITWRSVVGVIGMAVCVQFAYAQLLVEPQLPTVVQLLVCVSLGAASYSLIVLTLWWLSGRPAHAEAYAIRMARKLVSWRPSSRLKD